VVRSREYGEMIRCVATCSRFLNDLRTYEREEEQGKTNSVLLLAPRYGGSIEAAKREVRSALAASRRELLRMVVRDSGAVPRPMRQEFWNIYKVSHLMYSEEDGFTSTSRETLCAANAVVHEPLAWRLGGKIESPAAAASDKLCSLPRAVLIGTLFQIISNYIETESNEGVESVTWLFEFI